MLKELEPIADKLHKERAALNRVLDGLTEAQAAQTWVSADWALKDTLAHLAGAERGMLRMAQRMAQGENPRLPEGYNNDEYNARQIAKRKDKSLTEIRTELGASRAELMTFLENLTLPQLALRGEHPILGDTTVKDVLNVVGSHEASHCAEISSVVN
jgi:hypothetical protein